MKEKIFVDTDICLDLLLQRQPYYKSAAQLFTFVDKKKIEAYVSSLSFSHIHYILRHDYSVNESRKVLSRFKVLTNVLAVDDKVIELALQSDFKDFEDGIQYYTAIENNIKVLLTRKLKDYRTATIPIMTTEEYLKSLSFTS